MKNLEPEYLIANSALGVYGAAAAARALLIMARRGARIDPSEIGMIQAIATRGDSAPEHYIHDMEWLEDVTVCLGDPDAPLSYDVMPRDGDIWLTTNLSGYCDNCGAPLAACDCDVPNPTESPESMAGYAYVCWMDKAGNYEITRKADKASIAYMAGDDACILAREIARVDLLSYTDANAAMRAADDVMGEYDNSGA